MLRSGRVANASVGVARGSSLVPPGVGQGPCGAEDLGLRRVAAAASMPLSVVDRRAPPANMWSTARRVERLGRVDVRTAAVPRAVVEVPADGDELLVHPDVVPESIVALGA